MKQQDIISKFNETNVRYMRFARATGVHCKITLETGDVKDFFTSCDIPLALSFLSEYMSLYVMNGYTHAGFMKTDHEGIISDHHKSHLYNPNVKKPIRTSDRVNILNASQKFKETIVILKYNPRVPEVPSIPLLTVFQVCFHNARHSFVKGREGIFRQKLGSPMGSASA